MTSSLVALLDARRGRYRALSDGRADDLGSYLALPDLPREDEETLTEPILRDVMEQLLGFPPDGYIEQLSRSGLKPDFTPTDLVAHRFVLDAKSSRQTDLSKHEAQIRTYMDQRSLDHGVLFNLREVRVFRRGERGHDVTRSFSVLALWEIAHGRSMSAPEEERLVEFVRLFGFQSLDTPQRIRRITRAPSWSDRLTSDKVVVDVDYLVVRLRELSRRLTEDASVHVDDLEGRLALNPGRQAALVEELGLIALEIQPGADPDALPESVVGFRTTGGLPSRAFRQYLERVAQLALIRILLLRAWEDVGFVAEHLYNGGFGRAYERAGKQVREVLGDAFGAGRRRYRWLYGEDNNYDWYRPTEDVLVDVLYALLPVPLGKLDADVLGGLYESYVDDLDRDRLGQFYTPRSVVRFMLDRVGFQGREGMFRLEGDRRRPRSMLDFSTGSGGFLVEAARRIVDDVSSAGDVQSLDEGLRSVVLSLQGSEISPFPYFLTEVNLLLQVSRLLGRLREQGREPQDFVLSVVSADTLATRNSASQSLEGIDPGQEAGEQAPASGLGLVARDSEKREAFQRIRDGRFDFVVGNPPYVFESGNKVLFDRLRNLPQWKGDYRGKSDYLYYFLLLAAEKLAPGGRMCVITPAAWMNAGAAEWLRTQLTASLTLDELFLFGSYPLFAPELDHLRAERVPPPPTIESAILVATRKVAEPDHRLRIVELRDERALAASLGVDRVESRDLLRVMDERAAPGGRSGHGISVRWLAQSELRGEIPWPIKHGERELASRVVKHLDRQIDRGQAERLDVRWKLDRGIETAADAYSRRIRKRLDTGHPDVAADLDRRGIQFGEPIMELRPGVEQAEPWTDNPSLLARSPEPRAIVYGAIDERDYAMLVWIGRNDVVPDEVRTALEPWRGVLATRAGFDGHATRRWFETHRPRDKAALRGPKVVALYRTDRGRFAVDETGAWQPSNKATIATPRTEDLSVAYLCGLLNSELLDLWYALRGKTPRDVWRNYEPKPMARMPYRHVSGLTATDPAPEVQQVETALATGDARAAYTAALALPAEQPVALAQALELIVRAVGSNRRELLGQRAVAPELRRQVKDPWRDSPVELSVASLIAELPESETRSLRLLDDRLTVEGTDLDVRGMVRRDRGRVVLQRARQEVAVVTGEAGLLDVLTQAHEGTRMTVRELVATGLPSDPARFESTVTARAARIEGLLQDGRILVEAAEWIVGRLYGLPDALIGEVVSHARERAARGAPAAEDDT